MTGYTCRLLKPVAQTPLRCLGEILQSVVPEEPKTLQGYTDILAPSKHPCD
jgi:hypothetical protein